MRLERFLVMWVVLGLVVVAAAFVYMTDDGRGKARQRPGRHRDADLDADPSRGADGSHPSPAMAAEPLVAGPTDAAFAPAPPAVSNAARGRGHEADSFTRPGGRTLLLSAKARGWVVDRRGCAREPFDDSYLYAARRQASFVAAAGSG
jgi:hypothetical protein